MAKDALWTPLQTMSEDLHEEAHGHTIVKGKEQKTQNTGKHKCPDAEEQNLSGLFTHRNENKKISCHSWEGLYKMLLGSINVSQMVDT